MERLRRHGRILAALGLGLLFVSAAAYDTLLSPPARFPSGKTVVIERGSSVPDIARALGETGIVRRPGVLVFLLRVSGAATRVQAGTYRFAAPENAFTIAYRLATGSYDLVPVRVTFTEGMTVREIALTAAAALPELSVAEIRTAGKPYEGYLFPDTYFFLPTVDAATLIDTLRKNFGEKLAPRADEVRASGHSLSDVITMASLIEKEARTTENRKIVAGILWDRLALRMPLQVDAVFGYIFDRDTYSPSYADLTVDSSYNTYTHTGLPPGPIDNPGLDAIDAALHPTKTKYLYYLTDKEGVMHYARTYAEHQLNQRKYLE